MAVTTQSVALPDGRPADVLLGGVPAGVPLLLHHGTPGDATIFADWHEPCLARGIRQNLAESVGADLARAARRRVQPTRFNGAERHRIQSSIGFCCLRCLCLCMSEARRVADDQIEPALPDTGFLQVIKDVCYNKFVRKRVKTIQRDI